MTEEKSVDRDNFSLPTATTTMLCLSSTFIPLLFIVVRKFQQSSALKKRL